MIWNGKWNATEILVWSIKDAIIEWNGRFQERNEGDNLIYFHTNSKLDFVHCFTEKYIPMSGGDKKYCHRSIQLQCLRILFVNKSQYFGCLYCANSVRIASL